MEMVRKQEKVLRGTQDLPSKNLNYLPMLAR